MRMTPRPRPQFRGDSWRPKCWRRLTITLHWLICGDNGVSGFMNVICQTRSRCKWTVRSARIMRIARHRMERALRRHEPRILVHFESVWYLERCALRRGNVRIADDWEAVLKPVIALYAQLTLCGYSGRKPPSPSQKSIKTLEPSGYHYATRQSRSARYDCASAQALGRTSAKRRKPYPLVHIRPYLSSKITKQSV